MFSQLDHLGNLAIHHRRLLLISAVAGLLAIPLIGGGIPETQRDTGGGNTLITTRVRHKPKTAPVRHAKRHPIHAHRAPAKSRSDATPASTSSVSASAPVPSSPSASAPAPASSGGAGSGGSAGQFSFER
jgi:hypothetical protein